jgi:hypothetical protein
MSFYIASSRWFIALSSVFYLSVVVALWLIAWPSGISAVILAILLLDYRRVIKVHGLRTHQNSVSIIMPDCDKWQYQLFCGKQIKAKLLIEHCYRSNILLIMCFKTRSSRRYVLIPRDSLSQHNYRFLAQKLNS